MNRTRLLRVAEVLVAMLMVLPLAGLVLFSFSESRFGSPGSSWTVTWYQQLSRDVTLRRAIMNSLLLMFSVCMIAAPIGVAYAIAMLRSSAASQRSALLLILIPIAMPDVVTAVSQLHLVTTLGIPLGMITTVAGQLGFAIPAVALLVAWQAPPGLRGLEDAARDLGATEWRVLLQVTLAALRPALLAAVIVVATLSFDDFVFGFFLSGSGKEPLSTLMYSAVRRGVTPRLAAVFVVLLGTVLFWQVAYERHASGAMRFTFKRRVAR